MMRPFFKSTLASSHFRCIVLKISWHQLTKIRWAEASPQAAGPRLSSLSLGADFAIFEGAVEFGFPVVEDGGVDEAGHG